ncbi:helix-turn-helix domain-containing protein [Novispirillum itersonii]|uniref:Transcriptional regulator with XRE-family HTH domain n=1 Tax=Novispirillum itersonii TaxID=189 RepID=A0A7X0DLV3_NOVIT|nr:helix-turn-helix domain-containing protein [Novispirillum itersonii]MBB6209614.1 transcriptional regulator with XRE-family HTH domain [Novispirillum itersonii]
MIASEPTDAPSLEARLTARLAHLRLEHGFSLDQLAEKSGISRATLSRLERGETSPTAGMLGALCAVFQTPLSRLIAAVEDEGSSLVRAADQAVWADPETGFIRRMISPPARMFLGEMIEGRLPSGADIRYDRSPLLGLEHHLWLLSGSLSLEVDGSRYSLSEGDCLRYRLFGASRFYNPGDCDACYVLTMIRP